MPNDLVLDTNTHDLDISSGTLTLHTKNINVTAQRVKIAILTKVGEWFKDTNIGVPYYQEFFTKKNNKSYVDSFMINYIAEVQDVQNVTYYESSISEERVLTIKVSFTTTTGEIITLTLEA